MVLFIYKIRFRIHIFGLDFFFFLKPLTIDDWWMHLRRVCQYLTTVRDLIYLVFFLVILFSLMAIPFILQSNFACNLCTYAVYIQSVNI